MTSGPSHMLDSGLLKPGQVAGEQKGQVLHQAQCSDPPENGNKGGGRGEGLQGKHISNPASMSGAGTHRQYQVLPTLRPQPCRGGAMMPHGTPKANRSFNRAWALLEIIADLASHTAG